MHRGYIKLWRKIEDTGILRDRDYWQFFCWCLFRASWKDRKIMFNGTEVALKAGEFIFGHKVCMEELNTTFSKVRTLLKNAKKNGHILTIQTTNRYSILFIINWGTYQGQNLEGDNQISKQFASSSQAVRKQFATNKKLMKLRIEALKKITKKQNLRDKPPARHTFDVNSFFEEFWTAYPYRNQKKLNKKQALDQYRKHVKDEAQAKQILEAVKKYAIHTDAVKDAFRWIRDENYKEWFTPDIREGNDGAGRQLIARYSSSELQMLKNDRDLRQELGISEEELDSAFRLIADNADQPGRMESQCT